jgi:hypothetical protein
MQFKSYEDSSIDFDLTFSYGTAWRLKDPESEKLANPNINDGNYNFDQGDLVNNRLGLVADIDARHKNVGLFLRPRAFHDFVYMGSNANYAENPTPNNTPNRPDNFPDDTEDMHGGRVELLDAFIYTNLSFTHHTLQLRLGNQVIQWGESLYIQGGIASAMAHADLTAASAPGTELKEILLPSGALFGQIDLARNISLAAYYQYEWEKNRIYESGSYLSSADFLDNAGTTFFPAPGVMFEKTIDQTPRDGGQYGLSLMFVVQALNETEFGLYFLNYNERSLSLTLGAPGTYHLTFAEDVKLYGTSFSTLIGNINVSGELSYRQGILAAVGSPFKNTDADVLQGQVSWSLLNRFPLMDAVSFSGEVGFSDVVETHVDEDNLFLDGWAWGYNLSVSPLWYQVFASLDVSMPISYQGRPNGSAVTRVFTEQDDRIGLGLDFTYKKVYTLSLKYVDFLNDENRLSDRDYASVTVKSKF